MTNENIYSAPQSDVTPQVDETNEIEIFPRMSAWKIFFLAIPTIGFYPSYWLYTRTKLMNTLPNHSLSMTPATIMIAIAALSVPFSILSNVYKDIATIAIISGVVSLVGAIFNLITVFSLRTELQHVIDSSGASEPSKLGGVKTFFFQAIYLQYKINECIDARNK